MPRAAFSQIVNRSMSEVLTRSLATSVLHGAADPGAAALRRRDAAATSRSRCCRHRLGRVLVDLHRLAGAHALEGARAGLQRDGASASRPRTAASCPPTRRRGRLPSTSRRERKRAAAAPHRARARGGLEDEFEEMVADLHGRRAARRDLAADRSPRRTPRRRRRARPTAATRGRPRPTAAPKPTSPSATSSDARATSATGGTADGRLAWVMMGLAIWHFTIFLPDHFWGGIVGAFIGALIGSVLVGLLIHGFTVPGRNDTEILTALEAIPGALIGMAFVYFDGVRRERADAASGAAAPRGAGGATRRSVRSGWRPARLKSRPADPPSTAPHARRMAVASAAHRCALEEVTRPPRRRARLDGSIPRSRTRAPRASSASATLSRRSWSAAGSPTPTAARAWLAADERHDFTRCSTASTRRSRLVLGHRGRQSRITVHGDYDVDGVCSTAMLVRALRASGPTSTGTCPAASTTATACRWRRSSGSPRAGRSC